MATIDWPGQKDNLYSQDPDFYGNGFNLRSIVLALDLYDNLHAFETDSSFSYDASSPHSPGIVSDTYYGTVYATDAGTGEVADESSFHSFVRYQNNHYLGSITGLDMTFSELAAVGMTDSKVDDIALFREAFSGDDLMNGGYGNDTFEGFDGDDTINGSFGADDLYGGYGADTFVYTSVKDSGTTSYTCDIIYDFFHVDGDKIDLSVIDAVKGKPGNQAFSFIGTANFHHKAGELRYELKHHDAYIYGDVNGDGRADFMILLKNVAKLAKSDFYL